MPDDGDGLSRSDALLAVCREIAAQSDERELINRILQVIQDRFGVEVCTLRLLNEQTGELVLAGSRGLTDYSKPVSVGQSVVGRVVLERKAYCVPDVEISPYRGSAFVKARGLKSLLSVPLVAKDRVVGGLTVYSREPDRFSQEDSELLCAMASQLGLVAENSRLERDTMSTLVSLARSIETKDSYTRGHSERVTFFAARLAERAGLSPQDVATMKVIGPIHDIGKIGVSEAIIKKPAQLSPKEYRLMQQHPVIGERIVGSLHTVQPGLFLIRNHHERMDGEGYPDGLKGEEIPLTVRVLTIADSYDAMTSLRPYRDPRTMDAAVEELRRCSPDQFDPELVGAFGDLAREGLLAAT